MQFLPTGEGPIHLRRTRLVAWRLPRQPSSALLARNPRRNHKCLELLFLVLHSHSCFILAFYSVSSSPCFLSAHALLFAFALLVCGTGLRQILIHFETDLLKISYRL
jgi:hypothetical protein